MDKIPKCITRKSFTRHCLKLTGKNTVDNRFININYPKKDKSLNISKQFSKETTANSLISTKKPSTISSTSSKSNSLIIHRNVIYIFI